MVLDRARMVPHAEAGSHSREEGKALWRLGIGFAVLLGQGLLGRPGQVRKWDMLCFGIGCSWRQYAYSIHQKNPPDLSLIKRPYCSYCSSALLECKVLWVQSSVFSTSHTFLFVSESGRVRRIKFVRVSLSWVHYWKPVGLYRILKTGLTILHGAKSFPLLNQRKGTIR